MKKRTSHPGRTRSEEASSLELLRQFRDGDRQALERLCERYLPTLRRWATGRLPRWARDFVDTDDLVQDTLTQSFRHLSEFEPRHDGALQVYLRSALSNRIRMEVRRGRRHPHGPQVLEDGEDLGPSPLELAVHHEALRRYESALARLRNEDREAIVLRIEMGCSYEQMAVALAKPSANAARMAVTRALLRLAEQVSRER